MQKYAIHIFFLNLKSMKRDILYEGYLHTCTYGICSVRNFFGFSIFFNQLLEQSLMKDQQSQTFVIELHNSMVLYRDKCCHSSIHGMQETGTTKHFLNLLYKKYCYVTLCCCKIVFYQALLNMNSTELFRESPLEFSSCASDPPSI